MIAIKSSIYFFTIRHIKKLKLLFYLLFIACFSCYAQNSLQQYIHDSIELNGFSGYVLVSQHNKIVLKKGYGKASFELDINNTGETKFRIGSLTKQFTSACIMLLVQKNKLNITDKLNKYLPNCPGEWKEVTIFHLLTHTSGIPELFQKLEAVPVEDTQKEIERVISSNENKILDSFPGEKYKYSNFGYILLGYIIEKVTNKNYSDFLHENIFSPAGMINTLYDDPRPIIKNRAAGYRWKNRVLYNYDNSDPAGFSAGGLLSTANDFVKWNVFLNSDKIFSTATKKLMFSPYKNNYALGWKVVERKGKTIQTHNGGTKGFVSCIIRDVSDDVLIVIFSNNEDETPWTYAFKILDLVTK